MEILARFSHEKIDHTKTNTPQLVLSLTAPELDWVVKRPSLCVIPLIDLSGSMDDPLPNNAGTKLDVAKKSLHKLVDQLQPGDVSGLFGFESKAHILVKPQAVTSELKAKLHAEIDKLRSMGGTNLCEGVLNALRSVENLDLSPKYIKRVIVFTDGEPTNGIMDKSKILELIGSQLGTATVSAFGYGSVGVTKFKAAGVNGCDPEFMMQISQTGKGNYAYVQNSDDTLTAFGREFGGLVSTYAQDIKVFIEPQSGHSATTAITDVKIKKDDLGEVTFEVPKLLSEETRHFVFDTKIEAQHKAFPRQFTIANVKIVYSVLTEKGARETKTFETKAKIRFVETGEEDKEISPALNEIVSLAQVVRAQLEAEEQAKAGQWAAAQDIMKTAARTVKSRGLSHTARLAESVGTRLTMSAYADSGSYLRSVSAGATRGYGVSMDHEAAEDLSFMAAASIGNSSMAAYTTNFLTPNEPSVPVVDWGSISRPPRIDLKGVVVPTTTHDSKPEDAPITWAPTVTPEKE